VEAGERFWLPPLSAPGFHVKAVAPVAVTLTVLPEHNVGVAGLIDTVGFGSTVIESVASAALRHPSELVPDTE
jgi:hypothetical protein